MLVRNFMQLKGIIYQKVWKITFKSKYSAETSFLPNLCTLPALTAIILSAELLALVLTLTTDNLKVFNWQRLGLVSLTTQWVALLSAALLCRLRPQLSKLPQNLAGAYSALCVFLILFIVLIAQQWWLTKLEQHPFDYWALLNNTLIGAICAGIALRYAYIHQQLANQQQARLNARIEALQARIHPHFLFNSMNSLASLIATDPERAERLVEDLSTLFRASLADFKLAPLEQELTLAHRYLAIEALRLGPRLQQNWQIDAPLQKVELPTMLLQPLLENAIIHGIARRHEGGTIHIAVSTTHEQLKISIKNPLSKADPPCQSGNGMALSNIRQRLSALYGNNFSFFSSLEQELYQVELYLPLRAVNGNNQIIDPATTKCPITAHT